MNISFLVITLVMLMFANSADITLRGHVVCMLEEKGDAPKDHEHQYAFKTHEDKVYPLFRSITGESIFMDQYVRDQELQVTGRIREDKGSFEVIQVFTVKKGILHELFYWCETCRIRSTAPGPCWCCFEPFELREVPVNQ